MATASITSRPATSSNQSYRAPIQQRNTAPATAMKHQRPQHMNQQRPQNRGGARTNRNSSVLVQPAEGVNSQNNRPSRRDETSTAPTQTAATNNTIAFYVPQGTPCFVSSDDGQWHPGVWGDNHRTITVYRSRRGPNPVFVRFADVVLQDRNGMPMYMAANRSRPCFITFPSEIFISLFMDASRHPSPSVTAPKTPGFEPISVEDAFALGVNLYHNGRPSTTTAQGNNNGNAAAPVPIRVQRNHSDSSIATPPSTELSSEGHSLDSGDDRLTMY